MRNSILMIAAFVAGSAAVTEAALSSDVPLLTRTVADSQGEQKKGEPSKDFVQKIRQAIDYAQQAREAGQQGNADELVKRSRSALDVAKEAQRAGHNERLNEGVYALGEAIEHGKKKETRDATEHVMHAIMKLSESAGLQIPQGAVPPAS